MWIPEKLSREQIEVRSRTLLIDPLIHQVGQSYLIQEGLRFRELYERVIWPLYGIGIEEHADLSHMCDGRGALGAYFPDSNIVKMDWSMSEETGDPRRTFTIFHEVCGHGVLQGQ